jgi:hypothetical protein
MLVIVLSLVACRGGTPAPESPQDEISGQLTITTLQGYLDEYGYWHIVGLLRNDSQLALSDIEMEVDMLDDAGTSLYKQVTSTMINHLAPGESSPFEVWVYEALPNVESYTAKVISSNTTDLQRASMEITNVIQVVDQFDTIYLTGEVINNGTQPVEVTNLAASLYNDSGEIVTAGTVNVIRQHLEPGEIGPFRFNLYAPANLLSSLTRYEFHPDVIVAQPAQEFSHELSSFNNYLDISGNFHLFGTLTNTSDLVMSVAMVAGIYDAAGIVLDASSTILPVISIAPGEQIPFDFVTWGAMSYTEDGYAKAAEYSVDIDYYQTYETSIELVPLTTQEDANTFTLGEAKFFGSVVNDSGQDLAGATVIVALYARDTGSLIATNYDWIIEEISNGDTATYDVDLPVPQGFDPNNMEYELIARGEVP